MMLTRCPACSTTFRVSPEQLKVRAGKVRCGQCQSQFNALDTLVEEHVFPATLIPAHEDVAQPSEEMVSPAVKETGSDVVEELVETLPEISEEATYSEEPEPLHAAEEITETDDESEVFALSQESTDVAKTISPTSSEVPLQEPSALEEPYDTAFEAVPDGGAETEHRRWPWAIGILAGLLVLAAQIALHFRVELAVLQPALKPTMIAACKALGCEVPLPQHAEFLGIEASDLHPDPQQKGRLVLAATLRNQAPFAQELPAIELTLNDVADRPLIVKALSPRDYLPKEINVSKGFVSNGELAVNLTLDVGDVPAAGYRIYLFYP